MIQITVCEKEYILEQFDKEANLLELLQTIKTTQNQGLSFRSGCRSGVCGSCAVRVNGKETLCCKTIVKDKDTVIPLKNSRIIRDLVVDLSHQETTLQRAKAFLENKSEKSITPQDQKAIDLQSNCILCTSCYSSCPVYEVNPDFIGPFALTRNYRYVHDTKEENIQEKIDAVQQNGVWDCTLCGNCNMVCPEHIDIKNDIMMLRNKSVQLGYSDPNMANFGSFDFGFNPNGF